MRPKPHGSDILVSGLQLALCWPPLLAMGDTNMAQDVYEAISRNPKYQELVRKRSTLARLLSVVMFIIYFGFILLIAYAPKFLGTPLGAGVTTRGIPLGLLVIVSAFALTGI